MDYHQLYGEPPPSYKLAKYYPKANLNLNNGSQQSPTSVEPLLKSRCKEEDDKNSHIYENIDEVSHVNSGHHSTANRTTINNDELDYSNGKSAAKRKRARFQALKKHSSVNNNSIKTHRQTSNSNSPSDSISDPNDRSLTLVTNSTSTSSVTSSKSSHATKHYLKGSSNVLVANKSSSEQFL